MTLGMFLGTSKRFFRARPLFPNSVSALSSQNTRKRLFFFLVMRLVMSSIHSIFSPLLVREKIAWKIAIHTNGHTIEVVYEIAIR